MAAVKNLGAVVLAACALAAWATVAASAAAQQPGLHLVVLQGEDGENVIEQGAEVPTLVEVRDRNELPVAGASVVFLLGDGGTATLNAGLREVSLTTNALGQAAVMVNPVAVGLVELSVAATFMGETAEALIVQTNFATAADAEAGVVPVDDPEPAVAPPVVAGRPVEAAEGGGGLGTGAILGLAGAGGAVGVGLAVAGGGDSPPPVTPPVTPPEPPASVPSRPSTPSVSAGNGLLDVSWSAPASNGATINDYDVQYRRSGAAGWEDHPGQFLDRRATIGNLQNGTTYEVRVRAGNSVGKGDWSPSGTGTPVAPASVPSRPSAPSISAGDGPAGRQLERAGVERGDDRRLRRAVSPVGRDGVAGPPRAVPRPSGDDWESGERYDLRGPGPRGELGGQGGLVAERYGHAGGVGHGAVRAVGTVGLWRATVCWTSVGTRRRRTGRRSTTTTCSIGARARRRGGTIPGRSSA